MSESNGPLDWNLLLIGTSQDGPERMLRFLGGAVSTCGAWILSQRSSGDKCAEMDFEFPRANCVEIYSVLVAAGVMLSQEAHKQLTELCQCTKYLLQSKAFEVVRLQLTVYTREAELEQNADMEEASREAA